MSEFEHDRAVEAETPTPGSGVLRPLLCRVLPHDFGMENTYEEFDEDGALVYASGGFYCSRCGQKATAIPVDDGEKMIIVEKEDEA